MADVRWIKIVTDIFDDEKILLIETLPEADSIIVIWFKLLCLAGKQNNSGVFMMNDKIPYTDKMFATIFRRKESTVQLALHTFQQFGMVEIVNDAVTIPNWGKHQNLEAIEARREYKRIKQAEYRLKQTTLISGHPRGHTRGQNVDALEENKKENREDKRRIEGEYGVAEQGAAPSPAEEKAKEKKHKYGEYDNVLLSDAEFDKLKAEYPDYQQRIERLSAYIASKGVAYKSHYATIRNWARKDAEREPAKPANNWGDALDEILR